MQIDKGFVLNKRIKSLILSPEKGTASHLRNKGKQKMNLGQFMETASPELKLILGPSLQAIPELVNMEIVPKQEFKLYNDNMLIRCAFGIDKKIIENPSSYNAPNMMEAYGKVLVPAFKAEIEKYKSYPINISTPELVVTEDNDFQTMLVIDTALNFKDYSEDLSA